MQYEVKIDARKNFTFHKASEVPKKILDLLNISEVDETLQCHIYTLN